MFLLGSLASCGVEGIPTRLQVVSWTGDDQQPVALDQVLKVEFNFPLAKPMRASSVELVDEGGHVVDTVSVSVVGRWIHIEPRLPLRADLSDGSLHPNQSYGIRLHGLPWLRALAARDGSLLPKDLILRFHTADAASAGALAGRGVESSQLGLLGPSEHEPHVFLRDQPVLLHFSRGIDPRTLRGKARWQAQGQMEPDFVTLRLIENTFSGAVVEVNIPAWVGGGALELPAGVEGLGGWPLPESDRVIRMVRRSHH